MRECLCVTFDKDGTTFTMLAHPRCPEHGPCVPGWHNPSCPQSAPSLLRGIFEDALTEEDTDEEA